MSEKGAAQAMPLIKSNSFETKIDKLENSARFEWKFTKCSAHSILSCVASCFACSVYSDSRKKRFTFAKKGKHLLN